MVTAFVVVQVGINVALLVLMARLLWERAAQARQARDREERLEALAVELCAVAGEFTRHEPRPAQIPSPAPAAERAEPCDEDAAAPAERTEPARPCAVLGERVRGAATLLAQGIAVERVAEETSLLPGEVQVLRNLHRMPEPEREAVDTGHAVATTHPQRTARRVKA